ncbi:MAG: McrB family protein [Arcticibacter sp.]
MELPRIFIAPRSGEQSSNNFAKTIEGGYNKTDLFAFLSIEDKEKLKNHETLMIWGNKPKLKTQWGKMQENDWVIFYQHGKISYVGKLLYKTHNKLLSDNLWGEHRSENGEMISWEYVYFLKELEKVDFPYKIMADLAGYKGSVVQGFQPYKEIGVQNIISQYGSVEKFFFNAGSKNSDQMLVETIPNQLNQYLNAIKTKPFILLAGISGTGKSRLVRTLAYKTCAKDQLRTNPKKPGNFELIPVRPNWHDSSELMGYVSRINGEKYITTSFLRFIAKAWKNEDVPFLLCLDEMNLAPVEQYFAEYLSIIETRQLQGEKVGTDYIISKASFEKHSLYSQLLADLGLDENDFSDGISIPNNLVVIGTVNMDETTHSFSRKVLDRAMTFEMNNVDLAAGLDNTRDDWSYPETFIPSTDVIGFFTSGAEVVNEFAESKKVIDFLKDLNTELEGTPFKIAYRVRDEFLIYCYYASLNKTNSNWFKNALDEITSMKNLSRIEGDETKTGNVLKNLQKILNADFKKSNAKLKEMEARLSTSGYTSFWS